MGVSIIILLPQNLLAQSWEVSWDLCCWHCAHKWCHGAVVEALTPHGMSPTSTPNIYKVIDNLHMLWMRVWRSHHTVTTKLVGPDLGRQLKLCHLSVHKWCHGTVIEALNPYGMAPTSTSNTYKVIANLYMLWMGVWIHDHAILTTLVSPDLWSKLRSVSLVVCTQMMIWHRGWGSTPTWDGSHINSNT